MDRRSDPRSIVTPYAFSVHPGLLGVPLATPWQRLGAILVDLVVIGFLSLIGGNILALSAAAFLLWLSFRKPGRDAIGKLFRVMAGCLGATVLGIALLVLALSRFGGTLEEVAEGIAARLEEDRPAEAIGGDTPSAPALVEALRALSGVRELSRARSEAEAQRAADLLARRALGMGLSPSDVHATILELIPEGAPWHAQAGLIADRALASQPGVEEPSPLEAVAGAEAAEAAAGAAGGEAPERALREARRETGSPREEASLRRWLRNFLDDLGIGIGWGVLYLTIVHVWWKGRTVGKKLFRTRVVLIDQRPLSWWLSFERAGGYAAGFATGLLGFAQVFWDPNRQAIHDKISETIVIQDGKEAVPGPWIDEGFAQWRRAREG